MANCRLLPLCYRTSFIVFVIFLSSLAQGADHVEKDFDFGNEDIMPLKKPLLDSLQNDEAISTLRDDEDIYLDTEPGSGSTSEPGSGTGVTDYPEFFRVMINFTSIAYEADLVNRESPRFVELGRQLAEAIDNLFADIQGQQLVTVLQYTSSAPGAVLVTFDLGSQGYYDRMMLYNVLNSAVNSGQIGPYRVSPVGFSFKALSDIVPCPGTIGREPTALASSGNNWANLLVNNAFPCDGYVLGWKYYRSNPRGRAYVGVWRQTDLTDFVLVQKTELPEAPVGEHTIQLEYPIPAFKGDFIGIHHDRDATSGVIATANTDDGTVPIRELYQSYYIPLFDDSILEGETQSIAQLSYTLTSATFALQALMDYTRVPKAETSGPVLVTTCAVTEYRCLDGGCIPGNYRCDGQFDCVDDSDERGCGSCGLDEYTCVDGTCILHELRCNSRDDCGDGSDEFGCQSIPCGLGQFRCEQGQCIEETLRCDGHADCPDTTDELDCPGRSCGPDEFTCGDGLCILDIQRCNGVNDCTDQSDEGEDSCGRRCGATEFTCTSGQCIHESLFCDGTLDCADGSDEENCAGTCPEGLVRCSDDSCRNSLEQCPLPTCAQNEFRCGEGSCIDARQRCDRRYDCPDQSDEQNCAPATCSSNEFQCGDGRCIDVRRRCDTRFDCPDQSDEQACPCRTGEFTCVEDGRCIPEQRRCDLRVDCADGSDEADCVITCNPGEFKCGDDTCIDARLKCDGVDDCADGSDEAFSECGPTTCSANEFRCTDGTCIDARRRCDQARDCRDSSDEEGCAPVTCASDEFQCGDGRCIDARRRCDDRFDCTDRSDEQACPCKEREFTCGDGRCIPENRVCDRRSDCADGSDERNCPIVCSAQEFRCVDGSDCIADQRRCDGRPDCRDRSDEDNCRRHCRPDQFHCHDLSACVDRAQLCDGRPHCRDRSDELNCISRCRPEQFQCVDQSNCIDPTQLCNRRYDCRDGSDEAHCIYNCRQDQFRCADGMACIDRTRRCDGYRDCTDGSDEDACRPQCRPGQFECLDKTGCVNPDRLCDGRVDCRDRSDERNCQSTCPPNQFQCGTGHCLDSRRRCDRRPDCPDRSDEEGCPVGCLQEEFTCRSGECVSRGSRCNGRRECVDGSDERDCPIAVSIVPPNLTVRVGSRAQFQCQAEGIPPSQFRWSKGGRALSGEQGQEYILVISPVAIEHSGDYSCSVTTAAGTFQSTARLSVQSVDRPDPGLCSREESTCQNGHCIPRDYICDGEDDCSDGSDEEGCSTPLPCEPNEFKCYNGRCAMKIWRCDGDNDCGDMSDEQNCPTGNPGDFCAPDEFSCTNGDQCVPASYHCDGEIDCRDRSDEVACSKPTVIIPPVPNIDVEIGGTINIFCEAIGNPTPIIVWRLNWGNIPTGTRVLATTENGRGRLIISGATPTDSGAYTCEAINNIGSIFAIPDAIVIVRVQQGLCKPPYFNADASIRDECIRCFCFGNTDQCYSSTLNRTTITPGPNIELVRRGDLSPVEEGFIQYNPNNREFSILDFNQLLPQDRYFFKLPIQHLGHQLTGYGGELRYRVYYEVSGRPSPTNEPDVVIVGANGVTLYHHSQTQLVPNSQNTVIIPLVESEWGRTEGPRRGDTPIEYATREDLMRVLQNLTTVLIRGVYDNFQTQVRLADVVWTTAVLQATTRGRAYEVEECICPTGYDGLSCERCAAGFYRRVSRGGHELGECVPCSCNGHSNECDQFSGICFNCRYNTRGSSCEICVDGYYGDARGGTLQDCNACPCPLTQSPNQFTQTCRLERDGLVTCIGCPEGHVGRQCERCAEGYIGNPREPGDHCRRWRPEETCDARGSVSSRRNPLTRLCTCKQNAQGRRCDRCRQNTFYLTADYPYGCISCFCMGVTKMCTSTSWNRMQVGISFVTDRAGVYLTDMTRQENIEQGFIVNSNDRELIYRNFANQQQQTYFWSLPSRFLGDKVMAYGGNLRFTLQFRAGFDSTPTNAADVEIRGNNVNLVHRFSERPRSNDVQSFQVPIFEQYWRSVTGEAVPREQMLMALADLDTILIRATYSANTFESGIRDITMDTAEDRVTGLDRAGTVEHCVCPIGYRGLSCEDCATGYTRSGGGLYLGLCERCQCYSHSDECDSESGVCRNCQHNTEGDHCERCSAGSYGDATRGTRNDCQRCSCPLTEAPNQFSPTCILDRDNQITCTACPPGHTGRKCESCVAGYNGNPLRLGDYCRKETITCDCDPRGTVPNTQCDPITKQCQCKAYAIGHRCSSCRDGYFHLDEQNSQGCLSCWCSGVTNTCSRSGYYRDRIRPRFNADGSHNFGLTTRRLSSAITDGFIINAPANEITFSSFEGIQRERESLFFSLPPRFRGNKVSSYGGYLRFTLQYGVAQDAGAQYMDVDLEIISGNRRLYTLFNPKTVPEEANTYEIPILETSFRSIDGSSPTREMFLEIFADIDAMLIRATYNNIMASASLRDLSLDIAVPQNNGQNTAPMVERCQCPEGYTGLSCQQCASGYLQVRDSGPGLGRCVRCNCNEHAMSCDPSSGKCLNCLHNTVGDRCERCGSGYYGDATVGTPNDCRRCACPLTIPSNQFSRTCYQGRDNQITCDACQSGYTGRNCGECMPGYEGNPRQPRDKCRRIEGVRPSVTVSPIRLEEPVGSTAIFSCRVEGKGPFNIVWTRADSNPLPARSYVGTSPGYELTIPDLVATHSGTYVCIATNAHGSARAYSELYVGQGLRVRVEEPKNANVEEGASVRFICIGTGQDTYILSWSKDGGTLPSRAVDQNGVLLIPNVGVEDAGTYICTGSSPFRVESDTATLTVGVLNEQPTIAISPRYLRVKEGEPVMFTCTATGLPTPSLEWNRGGGGELSTESSFTNGVFRIPTARRTDEAEYYCKATNVVGMATVRTILYVVRDTTIIEVDIIIRQTSVVVTAGSVARLECYVREGGDVILIWTRQQRSLPPGSSQDNGILTIPNVQPSYSGTYVCTGIVPSGIVSTATATLTIEAGTINERPTATIEPGRQTVNEGTTGTLRCIVTGVPRPTVIWSRPRNELSSNHQVNGEILRIIKATMADRGVYVCRAESVAGRAQAHAIVEVERRSLPKIDIQPMTTQTIRMGGSALFQCRVMDGMPQPIAVWTRAGNEQFTSNTKTMDNGVIMIERVTGPEQGTYICTATNEVGTISASATLVITGPPKILISPSRLIRVEEGQRVSVECMAEGDPTPNVGWKEVHRASGIQELGDPVRGQLGSAFLEFNSIRLSDAGTYTCWARNDGGGVEQDIVIQVIKTGPVIDIGGPATLAVTEGQNVELTCTTTGLINPAVYWRRRQGPLPPGHTVSGQILFIPSIQLDYQGEYICRATANDRDYETSVTIIISIAPQVSVSPSDVTARPGAPLYLRCNARGTPPFQYNWSKVGSALSPTAVVQENGVLEIRQVTAADAGTYRCVAVNEAGQGEGLVRVSIVVPPTVSLPAPQETRIVGQIAELRCIATGTPAPVVVWEREGGNLPAQHSIRGGILTLYSLRQEDEGRYVCVASNDGGTNRGYVYLIVEAPPDTNVPTDTKTVDVGDRVEFECVVTGAPKPTVSWRKLEGPLPAGSIREGGILIIPKVIPTDAGTYRCTATNTAGSVETQVNLYVRAQPVIGVSHDVQTAALGEPITLGCDATGFPQPVVTWSKQYGELPREHSIVDGDLNIPLLRREDAGTYMCNAVNQYGRSEQPVKLIVGDLVPYFPQAPLSYMSYSPLRDAYMDFDIKVSFRPEATDGLVMYNGQYDTGHGDFICFGMRGSKPEFRFDVGSGPAIIQGNHSLELNKWHTIQLKRNRRDGTMLVNDEPAYMGSSGGRFVGLDLEQDMYLGGVPNFNNIPRASGFSTGFVGSISEVILQSVDLDLGGEALQIVGIKQSQVCFDGACSNGGTCEPANVLYGFRCTCPQGFAGMRCDVPGERCYPGACGANGRCYNLPTFTGFRCVCPIGRYGKGCQEGLTISKPAFNLNAFISYPTIEDGLIQVTVKLVFKLQSLDDGIILYNSQKNDGDGDFISLSIKDGYLEFRYDTGSGPAILRSQRPLRLNEWFTIVAERDGSDGTLIVNSDVPVRGSSQGNTMGLNLKSKLFLGGADPAITVSPSVGVTQGFVGCVEELEINDREIDLLKSAIESANIKDCGDRRPCDRRPCQNGGTCQEQGDFDYLCVCHRDFTGKDCNVDVNVCSTSRPCQNGGICHALSLGGYTCNCQLNFMGRNCETSIVMETSIEVRGDGWLELSRALLPHRSSQLREIITFSIETTERDGLIFWQAIGANEQLRGRDFIAVAVRDGYIEFSFELGNGVTSIRSVVRVDDGYEHKVAISRLGRRGNVQVDQHSPVMGDSIGSNQMLNTKGNIYLGGAPDLRRMTDNRYKHSFNGCIRDLVIQNKGPIRFSYDAISAINVHPCLVT